MTAFPFSLENPIEWPGPPPASADVVVVGAGVIGVTCALFLARRGLSVTLLEKGRVAGEQSSRNWGWIRQQGRAPEELPIAGEACSLWRQLARECGEDVGLAPGGVTYFAHTDKEMAALHEWMPHARAHGLDTHLMDGAQTAALIPGMSRQVIGAMETPSDMRAEPWKAVPALARLAAREGVTIVENCAVRTLDVMAGRVAGVVTEAGRIQADEVVVAGGAWSSLLLRQSGIDLPQLSVRGTVMATEPLKQVYAGAATDDKVAFRRRQDGGYTLAAAGFHELFLGPDAFRHCRRYLPALREDPLGTRFKLAAPAGFPDAWRLARRWSADRPTPFERMRMLDPAPNARVVRDTPRAFAKRFPGLGEVRVKAAWAGMIDAMPDVLPVVDRCTALPGLTVGTGMSAHGFGIGPGFGRVLADLVVGRETGHDLSRFRLTRFSDGSPIRPGPAL
ncbi:NAD(P)/FAD-dependent oxidoreductase [Salinicola aestuarinus]|uniref:NAD(P)/FAD-dependent oxidoreductase n=1 Tax=Salinicola aestuarinus TaxID=1949082 RepID=UPI000DA1B568|nr:FAD-binding oxidoreductase [Salinicola aestuarinus]